MRRSIFNIFVLFFAFILTINATAQSTSVTDRTPEQEATKQTEKLQQELNLTSQQAKTIYDINLKYARERKQSNKRSDAMNRIKKKNEEISRVLNSRQKDALESKRSTVQSVEIDGERRYSRTQAPDRIDRNPNQRSNVGTTNRNQDRPVRTDFNTRQPLNSTSSGRSSTNKESRVNTERPVRNSSSTRSQTDARRSNSGVSDSRSSSGRTTVRQSSPERTNGSRSTNTRETRNEPQRSSRESGSRR